MLDFLIAVWVTSGWATLVWSVLYSWYTGQARLDVHTVDKCKHGKQKKPPAVSYTQSWSTPKEISRNKPTSAYVETQSKRELELMRQKTYEASFVLKAEEDQIIKRIRANIESRIEYFQPPDVQEMYSRRNSDSALGPQMSLAHTSLGYSFNDNGKIKTGLNRQDMQSDTVRIPGTSKSASPTLYKSVTKETKYGSKSIGGSRIDKDSPVKAESILESEWRACYQNTEQDDLNNVNNCNMETFNQSNGLGARLKRFIPKTECLLKTKEAYPPCTEICKHLTERDCELCAGNNKTDVTSSTIRDVKGDSDDTMKFNSPNKDSSVKIARYQCSITESVDNNHHLIMSTNGTKGVEADEEMTTKDIVPPSVDNVEKQADPTIITVSSSSGISECERHVKIQGLQCSETAECEDENVEELNITSTITEKSRHYSRMISPASINMETIDKAQTDDIDGLSSTNTVGVASEHYTKIKEPSTTASIIVVQDNPKAESIFTTSSLGNTMNQTTGKDGDITVQPADINIKPLVSEQTTTIMKPAPAYIDVIDSEQYSDNNEYIYLQAKVQYELTTYENGENDSQSNVDDSDVAPVSLTVENQQGTFIKKTDAAITAENTDSVQSKIFGESSIAIGENLYEENSNIKLVNLNDQDVKVKLKPDTDCNSNNTTHIVSKEIDQCVQIKEPHGITVTEMNNEQHAVASISSMIVKVDENGQENRSTAKNVEYSQNGNIEECSAMKITGIENKIYPGLEKANHNDMAIEHITQVKDPAFSAKCRIPVESDNATLLITDVDSVATSRILLPENKQDTIFHKTTDAIKMKEITDNKNIKQDGNSIILTVPNEQNTVTTEPGKNMRSTDLVSEQSAQNKQIDTANIISVSFEGVASDHPATKEIHFANCMNRDTEYDTNGVGGIDLSVKTVKKPYTVSITKESNEHESIDIETGPHVSIEEVSGVAASTTIHLEKGGVCSENENMEGLLSALNNVNSSEETESDPISNSKIAACDCNISIKEPDSIHNVILTSPIEPNCSHIFRTESDQSKLLYEMETCFTDEKLNQESESVIQTEDTTIAGTNSQGNIIKEAGTISNFANSDQLVKVTEQSTAVRAIDTLNSDCVPIMKFPSFYATSQPDEKVCLEPHDTEYINKSLSITALKPNCSLNDDRNDTLNFIQQHDIDHNARNYTGYELHTGTYEFDSAPAEVDFADTHYKNYTTPERTTYMIRATRYSTPVPVIRTKPYRKFSAYTTLDYTPEIDIVTRITASYMSKMANISIESPRKIYNTSQEDIDHNASRAEHSNSLDNLVNNGIFGQELYTDTMLGFPNDSIWLEPEGQPLVSTPCDLEEFSDSPSRESRKRHRSRSYSPVYSRYEDSPKRSKRAKSPKKSRRSRSRSRSPYRKSISRSPSRHRRKSKKNKHRDDR